MEQPKSLTNDEVYAVTAYILALNKIIGENDATNAETLPNVRMPNREGLDSRYPDKTLTATFQLPSWAPRRSAPPVTL